jgi:antibiotic biosynthesis monooxygenase (ABM) superfamily enzyme
VEAGTRVLELVVYQLHEGVSREQFLATNHAVSSRITQQPGFISRELAYDAEGDRWVDVILESALVLHGTPAINPVHATTPARA